MKNLLSILSLVVFLAMNVNAQNTRFLKGDVELAIGVGLIPTFAADVTQTNVLPVSFNASYKLADHFSVGGFIAYSSSSFHFWKKCCP